MHIGKWFHHLMNPHCADCIAERACDTCANLREQLVFERNQNRELFKAIVELTKPEQVVIHDNIEPPKPVSRGVPWHVKQRQLEQEDRRNAEVIRNKEKEVAELEKELNIG